MLQEDAKTKRSTPAVFAQLRETDAGLVVDRVREALVELAERVVRERREMDDGVDALDVGRLHVADVAAGAQAEAARGSGVRSQPSYSAVSSPTTSWPAASRTPRATEPT